MACNSFVVKKVTAKVWMKKYFTEHINLPYKSKFTLNTTKCFTLNRPYDQFAAKCEDVDTILALLRNTAISLHCTAHTEVACSALRAETLRCDLIDVYPKVLLVKMFDCC